MTRTAIAVTTLLFLFSSYLHAQVQYSVGNYMRYGNGEQFIGGQNQRLEYLENQSNVRLFWDNVTIGFQYLYDDPPEFGPRYQGLKKRYVEFSKYGLELRAGDYYTLYGRGLSMNLFENRGINYDTGLDGFRGIYRNEYVTSIIALGTLRYYDLVNTTRIETYSVKSGHMELFPVRGVRLGANLVGADGELPSSFGMDKVRADIPGVFLGLSGSGFDVYAEYAHKRSSGIRPRAGSLSKAFQQNGEGIYGSLSYVNDIGLGITFEYKDYRFDPVDPLIRADANRPTRMLPMQNPPIVQKEHAFNLLSRNQHIIDFNDEIGLQMDIFYSVSSELTVNLNAAVSSRHTNYKMLPNGSFETTQRPSALLPSLDEKFSPFYELYAEAEWYFESQSNLKAAINYRYDAPYEDLGALAHVQSSMTIPLKLEYVLTPEYAVSGIVEQQFYHDSFLRKADYSNTFLALILSKSPTWTAAIRTEFTTDDADPSGKKNWIVGEFSYRLMNTYTTTISFGTERGGLVCSSGICRLLNPFDGVRLSFLSQI